MSERCDEEPCKLSHQRRCGYTRGQCRFVCVQMICPTGGACELLSSQLSKNISVLRKIESSVWFTPFRAEKRGVRVVTNVERNAVDAKMLETTGIGADDEIVWSWRAHASAKLATMLSHRGL